MNHYLKIFLLTLTFASCIGNNKAESGKGIENSSELPKDSVFDLKKDSINCFKEEDRKRIMKLLDFFRNSCQDAKKSIPEMTKIFSSEFLKEFKEFPCKYYMEAVKFKAEPDFDIRNQQDEECNKLEVYFNYLYTIEEQEEQYAGEKTFILYFIKDKEGEILLDGFGVAG
ncbi:hypothetical protein [Sinomicrobium pectinilyticum]|nr:hypothetical protein [Sinomicrobium pectinilyticum]